MPRGGARVGAGRKKSAPDINAITKDLVFPALCQAFRAEPDKYLNRYLTVELSKSDIKRAYGIPGLSVWTKFFKCDKIGGIDRNGVGYKTRWCLHLGSYEVAKLLVESLGHSLKDLPNPGFPPVKMQERLDNLNAYAANLKAKRALREIQK
jgi:hypothetical protein